MSDQIILTLNNGVKIPDLGLGVYKTEPGEESYNAVSWALKAGYRHIDTAARYRNEEDVGRALRDSGLARDQVFITTKLWKDDYQRPAPGLKKSLEKLGLDYVDLYLFHWPCQGAEQRLKIWQELEKLYQQGLCRAIGVSNFTQKHLEALLARASVVPAVNQIEFHPFLFQKELMEFCQQQGICIQAYSPLTRGQRLNDPQLLEISQKYEKTAAQILIRWGLQHNLIVLPKSKTKERILENFAVFDFEISQADMERLDSFNENFRTMFDPTDIV